MARYISNAFSLQMLAAGAQINVAPATQSMVEAMVKKAPVWKSIIGHSDTASVVSEMLGKEIPANRENITLVPGDILYVAQFTGGRLPEGCKALPQGVTLKWLVVRVWGEPQPCGNIGQFNKSVYGMIRKRAERVASLVGGEVRDLQDQHGNYIARIEGAPGCSADFWDD